VRDADTRRIEQERGDERNNVGSYDQAGARPICIATPPATRLIAIPKQDFEEKPCDKQKTREPVRHAHA
jgi:hypothetical protein